MKFLVSSDKERNFPKELAIHFSAAGTKSSKGGLGKVTQTDAIEESSLTLKFGVHFKILTGNVSILIRFLVQTDL